MNVEELNALLLAREDEHLEFKEARQDFDVEKLRKYCCALANERGGRLILGVTDRRPRRVVGTRAFEDLGHRKADLAQVLRIRVDAFAVPHPDGRVVVFDVPSRPIGVPIRYANVYWMRADDSLTGMTEGMLRRIFSETGPDFSAEGCAGAAVDALDPAAIERFRARWHRKSGREELLHVPVDQLLRDAELIAGGGVTYAALALLGTHEALGRFLAQAEVVFEYRSSDASGPAQERLEFRRGFFLYDDELWKTINLRNDKQHFQDGLFIWDIPTFDERAVREALLNAVSHRDYRLAGSVFVRQYPRRLEIESPGGFPAGITPTNILWSQSPRNRRIAETLGKCGLVERSGQGANVMFEQAVRESKPLPDYAGSDEHRVLLTLGGEIRDVQFLRYLEQVGKDAMRLFSTDDFVVLNTLRTGDKVPDRLRPRLDALRDMGLIESMGLGRGARYMLARKWYVAAGNRAGYTRRRGLDRDTNKALLMKHLEEFDKEGSPLAELCKVLPGLSYAQVQRLVRELREEGRAHPEGRTKGARWFPGPNPDGEPR
jgi:ATP-dependent DNA helicase RecG